MSDFYFGVDEYGQIIFSETNDVLPEEYLELYPESIYDLSVSDGDANSGTFYGPSIDYDELIEALSTVPSYTIYPATAAIDVFEDVLNGLDHYVGYFIVAGSSNSDNYLYYSTDYDIQGNKLILHSPVTMCRYYSYRPTNSSTTIYTYQTSTVGEQDITLSNQLVYTNLIEGYPDIVPYKSKESYSAFLLFGIFIAAALSVFLFKRR